MDFEALYQAETKLMEVGHFQTFITNKFTKHLIFFSILGKNNFTEADSDLQKVKQIDG